MGKDFSKDKIYEVAVLGGGAAGILATIELLSGKNALLPSQVVLLERNDRIGKKILATGNGQCNLSNANVSEKYYHGDKNLIAGFIENYSEINLIKYFENLGIITEKDNAGRIYPVSRQASSFLDQLRSVISFFNPEIITEFKADKILLDNGIFTVRAGNKSIKSKNVIFACGGKAGENFGTDGVSYALLSDFGHNTTELYPSIVKIKTERDKIKGLKNLKERAKIKVFDGEIFVAEFTGDVLFTDFGVSGNAAYSASAYIQGLKKPLLKIEFLPEFSAERLADVLNKRKNMPYVKEYGAFVGLINKRIGQAVEKSAKSDLFSDMAYAAKNFTLKVEGTAGFSAAQTTKGGLTGAINKKTYESLNARGLYIVGESLNVDGDCGGYNLTFAFITGITAARDIKYKK